MRLGAGRVLASTEQAGLVVSERTGRRLEVRLAHPLYAEVIRRRTSPLRQRETFRILAQTLDMTGARRAEDKPRLVRWRLAAGLPTDPQLVRAAAETLLRKDFPQAEQLAKEAVRLGGGFAAKFLLAQVRIAGGRHADADALLAELAGETVSDVQHARVAATRARNLAFGLGRAEQAEAVLDTAETAVSSGVDELATARAALRAASGAAGAALDLLGPVLDRNRRGDPLRLAALVVAAGALAESGRVEACLGVVDEGLALAGRISDADAPGARARLEHARIVALCGAGRVEEAEDLAGDGYRDAIRDRWGPALAGASASLGTVALAYGNLRGAIRWLREALATEAHDQPHAFRPAVVAALARATAMTGKVANAPDVPGPLGTWAHAWVAAARGELTRAADLAASAAASAVAEGRLALAAEIRHDVLRFGTEVVPVDLEGRLPSLYAEHARASDAASLDEVATGFADVGARLLAAEAAAQAARLYRAEGKLGSAGTSAQRARSWLASCEDAATPALALLETPLDLTDRELEIARLVATGLTSRAVADRLVVSVRTVDNVLHGVYAKLGISGRRELASVVGRPEVGVVPPTPRR